MNTDGHRFFRLVIERVSLHVLGEAFVGVKHEDQLLAGARRGDRGGLLGCVLHQDAP
jgi:hypothetical protein